MKQCLPLPLSSLFTCLNCCSNVVNIGIDSLHNLLQKCLQDLKDLFLFFLYHSKVYNGNAWSIL